MDKTATYSYIRIMISLLWELFQPLSNTYDSVLPNKRFFLKTYNSSNFGEFGVRNWFHNLILSVAVHLGPLIYICSFFVGSTLKYPDAI